MAAKQRIAVIGAGGCGREVAWTLREAGGGLEFARFATSDNLDELEKQPPDGFVLGIGAPALRVKMFEEVRARFPNATWPTVIHPSVQCDFGSASFGAGVVICAGAIVTINVRLDDHVLIHYGSIVSHETTIGKFTNVNPGCAIAGAVVIEEEVSVGLGARIIQNVRVGARSVIGAGAVVIRDVEPGTTVVGVPARPIR